MSRLARNTRPPSHESISGHDGQGKPSLRRSHHQRLLFLALVWDLAQFLRSPRPGSPRASAAALLGLASMRSWMAPEGAVGRGRSFRPRESPARPNHQRRGSHRPIEDLLSVPGLRCPPDDCGEIPAVWRKTQSSIGKYVLGANRSRHFDPKPAESAYSTRVGIYWPRLVRTARRPHLPGVHPTLLQWHPALVLYRQVSTRRRPGQPQPGPQARPRLSRPAAGGWRPPGRRGSRV